MKKNLQEMEVKAINKSAILESHDGEEFSLITVAKNVLCEDGTTMQDYFDSHSEPNISTKIVNSNSMSKVGQGDNVDFSDNVMNGAYEDVVLKGKSLVNVIQEPSSQDVVLPYAFEDGQYVTINDTKESGALGVELKGQTLVNLAKKSTYKFSYHSDEASKYTFTSELNRVSITINEAISQWRYSLLDLRLNMLKPNTKYFVKFEGNFKGSVTIKAGDSSGALTNSVGIDNNNYVIITTNDLSSSIGGQGLFFFPATPNQYPHTYTLANVVLIEYQDGMENWDIPYFEGMQSVKMPILKSVNQMFDYSLATKPSGSGTVSFTNNGRSLKADFEVARDCTNVTNITLPAGTYEISYEIRGVVTLPDGASLSSSRAGLSMFKSSQNWYNASESLHVSFANINPTNYTKAKKTITFDESVTVAVVYHGWNNNPVGWCEIKDIRIVPQGKTSILSLPEEVVLRGIGDVKDTLNLTTGEYVQRIGSITANELEASDYYKSDLELENTIQFGMLTRGREKLRAKTNAKSVCNIIPIMFGNDDVFHARVDGGTPYGSFTIWMDKTKLETKDVFGLIKWLRDNNAVIQYELATPIVTKINLPSTLKSWNTTTHIYSEIPENTLYPILSHSNPTYPVIIKPSTKYSIVANSYSNDHTNSAIKFNLGGATASTTVGNRVTTITTPSTLSNELLTMSGRGNKLNNVMVIEGDVVGDEPYFEGMCDSKSPILSNIGKNLCNVNRYMLACGSGVASNGYKGTVIAKNIKVKPNTTYTFSYGNTVNIPSSVRLKVMTLTDVVDKDIHVDVYSHKNRIYEHTVPNGGSFTTEGGTRYIAITTGNFTTTGDILIEDIEIKETTSSTTYEPYKSNTTTFDQKDGKTIVLRSLPNGVCDTLNVRTGEYVQNIGEIICDGSEDERWAYNIAGSGQGKKCFNLPSELTPHRKRFGYIICDCMPTTNTLDKIGVYNGEGLNILIDSDSNDVGVLKEILANKPITVQYELATPIVKQINVEGYPYAYENGHILLESGSQEQSLTPTIEYSIVANRGGQIRSNQRMVERHQKKLDSLYAMTLVNMIDSQYKQVLMKLKSELGSEVRTWDIE